LIFKLEISASAQVPVVEPFLYPPFHGSAAVSFVFDHQTPRNIDSNDGVIVIMQRRRRSSRIKSGSTFSTTDDFQKLSPEEFEEFVTKLFISQGHQAKRMGGQGDHSVDIKVFSKNGEKWIVQCKRWNGSIGEPTIRD